MDDTTGAERIAYRSTRGEGRFRKQRWIELAVYYHPTPPLGGQRFIAETVGRSEVEGETDRRTTLGSASLDRALQHFENSAPARSVIDQAHVWLEKNPIDVEYDILKGARSFNPAPAASFDGTTDREALVWLYGPEAFTPDGTPARGMIARIAADFGMGESSVRMTLKAGTGLRVPLAVVARAIKPELLPSLKEAARG